jgi:murein tripeptide amidase MpaA
MKTVLAALMLVAAVAAAKVDYAGHMVIRTTPTNDVQLNLLRRMQDTAIDFWQAPTFVGRAVDFRVEPQSYSEMARTLDAVHLTHDILHSDIGQMIDNEQQQILLRRALRAGKAFDFENYHTYEEIVGLVDQWVMDKPGLVSKSVIGTTYEGRDVVMTTIRSGLNKPVFFFDCGIHAREWISPATCIWIMNELIYKYGNDAEITSFVDAFEWKFIPSINPDGFAYTWSTGRLWRKNRNPGTPCDGVDINRNFAVGFGGSGASGSACSEIYYGKGAFSELESQAVRDVLASLQGRVKAAISMHSFSQLWLAPYGYNTQYPSNYTEMYRVMEIGVNALTATYGTVYEYGTTGTLLYFASGVTTDYYYDAAQIVYSYTIEVRDTGVYGFELPPDQILPTATETWNGLKAFTAEIMKTL